MKLFPVNFKLIFRYLFKNKILNGINIFGLSIGIVVVLLIFQYIRFEHSYDSFHKQADQIYRLVFYRHYSTGLDKSVGNNYFAGQIAYDNIPEIEDFFRCKKVPLFVQANNETFKEERAFYADSSFFDMLSYTSVSGEKGKFLREPNVVVLTESTAKKYFGNEDPIGKTIYRINPGREPLTVQGVVKDSPPNTHMKFDMVVSLQTLTNNYYCYTCNNTNTYFLLKEGSDPEAVSSKITALGLDYLKSKNITIDFPIEYQLQNIEDIHLHSNYRFEHEINGNHKYVMGLTVIAIFILFSALLNFSNIYRSLQKKRSINMRIRRINGASWKSIVWGFIAEISVIGIISLLFAYGVLHITFPSLKSYLEFDFPIAYLESPVSIVYSLLSILVVSILMGMLVSISFSKSSFSHSTRLSIERYNPKNIMLLVQFFIAIFLISGTIVVMKQMHFMQEDALTMNIDHTLVVKRPIDGDFNSSQNAFQQNLLAYPEIDGITYSTVLPGEKNGWVKGGIGIKGSDNMSDQIYQSNVGPQFFDFFDVKLLAGRQFYPDETNWDGSSRHLIVNKEAVNAFGVSNPEELIGQVLYDSDDNVDLGQIVGVVDGYFQNSLDQMVNPIIFNVDQAGYFIYLKLKKGNPVEIVSKVKTEFEKHFDNSYFEYFFLDDYFNAQYKSHVQFNRCFLLFSIMAIIISSLSLLGMVIMATSEKVKEIGIRKVNGANIWEVIFMLNKDYLKWVSIAFLIATPITWILMNKWLENFAYQTSLSWWIFVLSGLLAFSIVLLTVSWQSWKAATRNPVEALRYE